MLLNPVGPVVVRLSNQHLGSDGLGSIKIALLLNGITPHAIHVRRHQVRRSEIVHRFRVVGHLRGCSDRVGERLFYHVGVIRLNEVTIAQMRKHEVHGGRRALRSQCLKPGNALFEPRVASNPGAIRIVFRCNGGMFEPVDPGETLVSLEELLELPGHHVAMQQQR